MYQVGDYVYYGGDGVCRINKIAKRKSIGDAEGRLYYTIKPLCDTYVIHAPVNGAKVFIRNIISREEAERLIDLIPSLQVETCHNKATNQLRLYYEAMLNTHNCVDLIKLIKSIRAKGKMAERKNRKLGAVDAKYMVLAEDLLFSELSVALDMPMDKVPAYIESRLNATEEQEPNNDICPKADDPQ